MSAECDVCLHDMMYDEDHRMVCGWCELVAERKVLTSIIRDLATSGPQDYNALRARARSIN